jgi:hypothetical protein
MAEEKKTPKKEPQKSEKKEDIYAMPMIGGAAAGFLLGGPLGALVGAAAVDVLKKGKGAKKIVREAKQLKAWAQEAWGEEKKNKRLEASSEDTHP